MNNSWLDSILGAASSAYGANQSANAAIANAATAASAANANAAKTTNWTLIAIIGGAVLVVVGLVLALRK